MLKVDKEKVAANKFPIALLTIELAIVVLVVYLFYKLIGFEFNFSTRVLSLVPGFDPLLVFFFVISVVLLVAIHFAIKKKAPSLFEAQNKAAGTIKEKAIEKIKSPKTDVRAAALLLVEFAFVLLVVITIIAWVDPEFELIPWSRGGIEPPLTTVLNTIIAVAVLVFFYKLYSYTSWYRK